MRRFVGVAGVLAQRVKFLTAVPAPFLAALAVITGFMVFISVDQSWWWRIKEDYGFGWLVPVFAGYVVYDRWPRIEAALAACRAPGSARAGGLGGALLGVVVWGALLGGAGFFMLGVAYRAGVGGNQLPTTLAITMALAAVGPALIVVNAPRSPSPTAAKWSYDARLRLAALFVFPTMVWLISAPLYSELEDTVRLFLLRKVVTVVSAVFGALGLAVEQQGNVLMLPTGPVGVEDACSGIRSLTGCLFAGSFLAAVFLEQTWKKIALVVSAMVLAFFTNLGRALFLTGWSYRYGPKSIDGTVHDIAGYAVLGLTVAGLLLLLPLFNLKFDTADTAKA